MAKRTGERQPPSPPLSVAEKKGEANLAVVGDGLLVFLYDVVRVEAVQAGGLVQVVQAIGEAAQAALLS